MFKYCFKYLQKTSYSGDIIISSGESIKLSCSDSSEDDVRGHGDDLLHNENSKVSSSSAGDSQQEVKAIESEQHMEKRNNDDITCCQFPVTLLEMNKCWILLYFIFFSI
jgi:hypothetical protein